MSNLSITWAWQARVGDPGAKLVLIKLADQANDDGVCWPSQRTLSDHLEMPERTLRRKIEKLEAAGLVAITRRPNKSSVYQLQIGATGQNGRSGSAIAMAAEPSEEQEPSSSPEPVASDEATNSDEAAAALTANTVVRVYADECAERGVPRLPRTVAKLSGIAKREIAAHPEIPPGAWIEATGRVAAGRPPEMLAELAVEAMARKPELRPNGKTTVEEEAKRRVSEGLALGWPTGCATTRGSHGQQQRFSLWGRDKIEEIDWPYERPTYADLLKATTEDVRRERAEVGNGEA